MFEVEGKGFRIEDFRFRGGGVRHRGGAMHGARCDRAHRANVLRAERVDCRVLNFRVWGILGLGV